MSHLVASTLGFALGLLLLPAVVPGVRLRGMGAALKVGLVCGLLSVLLGKLLLFLLSFIFILPIVLLGPVAVFFVQALVNAILLAGATRLVDGLEFDRPGSTLWAAVTLTVLQWVVTHLL